MSNEFQAAEIDRLREENARLASLHLRLVDAARAVMEDVYYDEGDGTTGECWVAVKLIDALRAAMKEEA